MLHYRYVHVLYVLKSVKVPVLANTYCLFWKRDCHQTIIVCDIFYIYSQFQLRQGWKNLDNLHTANKSWAWHQVTFCMPTAITWAHCRMILIDIFSNLLFYSKLTSSNTMWKITNKQKSVFPLSSDSSVSTLATTTQTGTFRIKIIPIKSYV